MSIESGMGIKDVRRGSFANGGGVLAMERLAMRGMGLGRGGGGSFSHCTSTGEAGGVVLIGGRGIKTVDWSEGIAFMSTEVSSTDTGDVGGDFKFAGFEEFFDVGNTLFDLLLVF